MTQQQAANRLDIPSAEPDLFRAVMATVCSQVVVATAFAQDRPHGTTVTAFASLSLAPPLVSVALDRNSLLLAWVRGTGRLGINVLAHDQADIATRCSSKDLDKFDNVPWTAADGLPRIAGSAGWLACELWQEMALGDHVLLIGHVIGADATGHAAAPLVYGRRTFGTHSQLRSVPAPA